MTGYEHIEHTFAPVYDADSLVLILGTLPSVKSRENHFYYGHKQNRFWKVMADLCGEPVPETIEEKKKMEKKYTCSEILETLRKFQFADVGGQGFIPLYKRTELTDALHRTCGIETDFEFITKSKMKEIQKKSKCR